MERELILPAIVMVVAIAVAIYETYRGEK